MSRIDLPNVPDEIRRMILAAWIDEATRFPKTDPRWIEEARDVPRTDIDLHPNAERAAALLRAHGIAVAAPVPFERFMRQGGSTFATIAADEGWAIRVSELGLVADLENAIGFCQQRPNGGDRLPGPPDATRAKLTAILERDGFIVASRSCLQTVFEGLAVYCFAPNQVLNVADLLFNWQD